MRNATHKGKDWRAQTATPQPAEKVIIIIIIKRGAYQLRVVKLLELGGGPFHAFRHHRLRDKRQERLGQLRVFLKVVKVLVDPGLPGTWVQRRDKSGWIAINAGACCCSRRLCLPPMTCLATCTPPSCTPPPRHGSTHRSHTTPTPHRAPLPPTNDQRSLHNTVPLQPTQPHHPNAP